MSTGFEFNISKVYMISKKKKFVRNNQILSDDRNKHEWTLCYSICFSCYSFVGGTHVGRQMAVNIYARATMRIFTTRLTALETAWNSLKQRVLVVFVLCRFISHVYGLPRYDFVDEHPDWLSLLSIRDRKSVV